VPHGQLTVHSTSLRNRVELSKLSLRRATPKLAPNSVKPALILHTFFKHRPPNLLYSSPDDEDLELVVTLDFDFVRHTIVLKSAKFMTESDATIYNLSALLEISEVICISLLHHHHANSNYKIQRMPISISISISESFLF